MTIAVRTLDERDLPEADRIFRLAFGTFLGLPDPMAFAGDSELVRPRWRAAPEAALGAYDDGALVGSNFATRWGSFGFFGPLTVRPDYWGRGVAQRLLAPTMALFEAWGTRQAGLFTFPDSPKHHALYGKHGFRLQALTPVMAKAVAPGAGAGAWSTLADMAQGESDATLAACRTLTDAILPGLDLTGEIRAVTDQGLGAVVLVHDGDALAAFAVCHIGAGSEAGSGALFVKFGAARPGPGADERFGRLVAACEALAAERGLERLVAGTNRAREGALSALEARGFAPMMEGVAMQRPDEPGFNRADCFVIDDWR